MCLQKERKLKSQHAVEVTSDQDSSSDYGDNFDLGPVTVDTVRSTEAREIFTPVMFHPKEKRGTSVSIQGKVDTGAMVSCTPASMLLQLELSTSDLQPSHATIRGMSGTDLQDCGTIDISVSCNAITANTKFYITKCECAFVLGLGFCKTFKLVSVASVCTQHSICMETQGMEAVNITNESEANYSQLKKKWNKHLPLGKKTGNPLEDLKQIFPETFDGQVGRFEGEVNLKVSPNAKPTQLPPRAVPQSIMSDLKKELDKMEKKGNYSTMPRNNKLGTLLSYCQEEEWIPPFMSRPKESHSQRALHRILGRRTTQLHGRTVLLHTRCQEWVLDQAAG